MAKLPEYYLFTFLLLTSEHIKTRSRRKKNNQTLRIIEMKTVDHVCTYSGPNVTLPFDQSLNDEQNKTVSKKNNTRISFK